MKNSIYISFQAILICALLIISGCNFSTGQETDNGDLGADMWLGEASPNPMQMGGFTTIEYDLKGHRDVQLTITNVLDQEVRSLNTTTNGSITWNGTDKHGNACSSGVYFYKLNTGSYTSSAKMLLIK